MSKVRSLSKRIHSSTFKRVLSSDIPPVRYYCERRDEDGNLAKHRGRRILPLNVKREFREKEFVCYEFVDLTPIQEEDLFARVQMGMSLTPAEKLRATNGPWQDFARLFEEDFREVVNLSDTGRSAGFRHLLTCFSMILEVQHPSKANGKPILKQTPNDLGKLAKNEAALDDATKSHLARVFTTFKELIEDDLQTFKDNGYRNVKTFAPVEMVAVAVLISMYGDTRNHQLLLGDIRDLRTTLRQNLQDLRLNSITWNVVWEYLERLEQFRGAVDGSTIHKQKGRPRKKSSSAMVQPASPKNQRSLPPRIRSAKKQAEEQTDVPQVPPDMQSSNLQDIVPPVKHEEDDYETPLRAAPSLSAVETPARALAVHSNQPSIRSQSTQNRTPTGTATHPPVPTPTAAPAPALPTMQMLHDRFHSLTDPQRFNPINTAQPNINANLPDTNSTPNTRPTTTAHLPNPAYPVPPRTRDHITESPIFMRSSSPPDSVLDLSDDGAAGAAPPPPQHQHQHRRPYQAVAPTAPAAPMVSAGMRGRFNTNLPSRTVGGAGDAVTGLKRRAEIDFGYSGGGRGTVLKKRG